MSEEELRILADTYDSVYLHPNSYTCACLASGSVLRLVDAVLGAEIRNGMAIVRPPGHHAQHSLMDGYCMFNHVAIAARYAQQKHSTQRVLIVDWDVHHGQGTQFTFDQDPRFASSPTLGSRVPDIPYFYRPRLGLGGRGGIHVYWTHPRTRIFAALYLSSVSPNFPVRQGLLCGPFYR